MPEIRLTDADQDALDAINGAEMLKLRRERHVYHRVVMEMAEQVEQLKAALTEAAQAAEPVADPPAHTNGSAPVRPIRKMTAVGGDG